MQVNSKNPTKMTPLKSFHRAKYVCICTYNIYCETTREKTKWSRKTFAKLGG